MKVSTKTNTIKHNFLKAGGEAAELIASIDWSQTSLGHIDFWPQSLITTLGIILHSKFPMFLFWGPELICFYNDGYRPSLGNNGKHPYAMGSRAEDVWPEIWHIIKPMIDHVLTGGDGTWSEDQLIPIYRNGKIEDVYWTFSYSPVNDESGDVAGVFVTCTETTEKVNLLHKIEESEKHFSNLIQEAPVPKALLHGPDYVVEIANDAMLELWGKISNVIGKPLITA